MMESSTPSSSCDEREGISETKPKEPGSQSSLNAKPKQKLETPDVTEEQEHYLYLTDINPKSSLENLANYLEARSNAEVVKEKSFLNPNNAEALVVVKGTPDMNRLRERIQAKPIDGHKPSVYEVPTPTRIAVSSEMEIKSKDGLAYYFEVPRNGGGDLASEDVEEAEDGSCYILHFEDPKVVQTLCKRTHRCDGVLLRVSPFYSCDAGCIWDTSLHVLKIPAPVTVKLTERCSTFLQRQCCGELHKSMKEKHCILTFDDQSVQLSCTLTQSTPNIRNRVKTWTDDVRGLLESYQQQHVKERELTISKFVWNDLLQFFHSGDFTTTMMVTSIDNDRRTITLLGFPDDVNRKGEDLEKKEKEIDRRLRRSKETKKLQSAQKVQLLDSVQAFDNLREKFPEVDIHVYIEQAEVMVEGVPEDIKNVFLEVFQEVDKIRTVECPHDYTADCVHFVNNRPKVVSELNQVIQKKGLKAQWEMTDKELIVYVITKETADKVKRTICDVIVEKRVKYVPNAVELFRGDKWKVLCGDVKEKYENQSEFKQLKNENVILVFGLKNDVNMVEKMIKHFIEQNMIVEETMPCGSIEIKFIKMHAQNSIDDIRNKFQEHKMKVSVRDKDILLTGTKEGIKNTKCELDKLIKGVIKKKHKIEKVAVWNVLKSEKEKGTIEGIEKSTGCIIHLPDAFETYQLAADDEETRHPFQDVSSGSDSEEENDDTATTPLVFKAKHGVRIRLVKGELGKQSGDVLVVSTSPNLDLANGAAGRSILKVGGDELQQLCGRKYPKGIDHGELAVVDACGSLKCQNVYLTALPGWNDKTSAKQVLQKFMTDCLDTASKANKSSILFCALGTGQLKYPTDMVAMMMYQAVIAFDANNPKTSLKDVQFVLYHQDTPTIQVFEDEEKKLIGGRKARPTQDVQIGPVKVQLAVANLAEQKVDVILCTTSAHMDMSRGACQALVKAGGPTLQAECQTKYNNTLAPGQVANIGGGNLTCKSVFLTLLPSYNPGESEKILKDVVYKCLSLAQAKKYTSLATPALGTGFLKYPKEETCRWMYEAITDWATKNPSTCVKTVRFIMYAKDHDLIQAFNGYVVQHHGMVPKKGRHDPRLEQITQENWSDDTKPQKFKFTSDGVQVGEIFLTVCKGDILTEKSDAIVRSAGKGRIVQDAVDRSLLKKCPGLKDECEKQRNLDKINQKGVLVTQSFGLPSKHIIHAQIEGSLEGWRKKMRKCLQKANDKKWRSLSFPVLGSVSDAGSTTFDPADIAKELLEAIDEFASSTYYKVHVRDVRLVICKRTPEMHGPIMKAIHEKSHSAAACAKHIGKFEKMVNIGAGVAGFVKQGFREQVLERLRKGETQNTSSLELNIYSDKKENIDRCKKELDAKLGNAYSVIPITGYQEIIKSLTEKEMKNLDVASACEDLKIDIKIDQSTGTVVITGPSKQAAEAQSKLNEKLRYIEKGRNFTEEAETLYKIAVWHHEEVTLTGYDLIPYDKTANYTIEKAYKENKPCVEISDSTDGIVYVIDFAKSIDYPKGDPTDAAKVIRKDMIKAAVGALPNEWKPMKDNENIKLVTLAATDPTYQTVEKRFMKEVQTGPYANKIQFDKSKLKVTKIERVQNKTLYHQYIAKRKQMEGRNRSLPQNMPIDRDVWHGTTQESLTGIQTHGFNRSYCGKHGTWFGHGVYFAGDASYSARGWLTGANHGTTNVQGYVFLAKALTGQYCKGTDDMRYLPPVDPARPLELYDSTVDDVKNPLEFVIFHDTQAYPEYIITFTA